MDLHVLMKLLRIRNPISEPRHKLVSIPIGHKSIKITFCSYSTEVPEKNSSSRLPKCWQLGMKQPKNY